MRAPTNLRSVTLDRASKESVCRWPTRPHGWQGEGAIAGLPWLPFLAFPPSGAFTAQERLTTVKGMKTILLLLLVVTVSTQAQLVSVVGTNGSTPAILAVEPWQSAELVSIAPMHNLLTIEKNGELVGYNTGDYALNPLVIVGPARVRVYGQGSSSMATFRLSPEPYPPTQAMLVPPGTGGATVALECSTNLIDWLVATNGVYTNLPVAKFFRVRLNKIP